MFLVQHFKLTGEQFRKSFRQIKSLWYLWHFRIWLLFQNLLHSHIGTILDTALQLSRYNDNLQTVKHKNKAGFEPFLVNKLFLFTPFLFWNYFRIFVIQIYKYLLKTLNSKCNLLCLFSRLILHSFLFEAPYIFLNARNLNFFFVTC